MASPEKSSHKRQRSNANEAMESKSPLCPITSLDVDDDMMSASSSSGRREGIPQGLVRLNVGGKVFQTDARTLKMYPRSYFGVWFSGNFRIISEPDGSYFLDRNPDYFGYVLDFMRDGQLALPDDLPLLKRILMEAEFFQLAGLVLKLKAEISWRESAHDYENFRCQACRNVIGNVKAALEVNGKRFHTCVNPHGSVFNVITVPALHATPTGPKTSEGTWFQGYVWQFAHCVTCDAHLGWYFTVNPKVKRAEELRAQRAKQAENDQRNMEDQEVQAVLNSVRGAAPTATSHASLQSPAAMSSVSTSHSPRTPSVSSSGPGPVASSPLAGTSSALSPLSPSELATAIMEVSQSGPSALAAAQQQQSASSSSAANSGTSEGANNSAAAGLLAALASPVSMQSVSLASSNSSSDSEGSDHSASHSPVSPPAAAGGNNGNNTGATGGNGANFASLLARILPSPGRTRNRHREQDIDLEDPALFRDPNNPRTFFGVIIGNIIF